MKQMGRKERYLVRRGGEETRERAQDRGPGKPTHTDSGELQRLSGKQPPGSSKGGREAGAGETHTTPAQSGSTPSPLPAAADAGLILASVTAETKLSKPQRLSQS